MCATLRRDDVVHDTGFSHLVYSFVPVPVFSMSLVPPLFLAGNNRLIWDRKASPVLCPTSAFLSRFFSGVVYLCPPVFE